MPKFRLNKLVRDKIVRHQLDAGESVDYRKLDKPEHIAKLIEKLGEEAREIATADDPAAELADLQQIVDDLAYLLDISGDEIARQQAKKLTKNGGFAEGYFVETVECADDDEWTEYYRREPDRFPEVG